MAETDCLSRYTTHGAMERLVVVDNVKDALRAWRIPSGAGRQPLRHSQRESRAYVSDYGGAHTTVRLDRPGNSGRECWRTRRLRHDRAKARPASIGTVFQDRAAGDRVFLKSGISS